MCRAQLQYDTMINLGCKSVQGLNSIFSLTLQWRKSSCPLWPWSTPSLHTALQRNRAKSLLGIHAHLQLMHTHRSSSLHLFPPTHSRVWPVRSRKPESWSRLEPGKGRGRGWTPWTQEQGSVGAKWVSQRAHKTKWRCPALRKEAYQTKSRQKSSVSRLYKKIIKRQTCKLTLAYLLSERPKR